MPHFRSLDWPTYTPLPNLQLRDELGARSLIQDALSAQMAPPPPSGESESLLLRPPRPEIALEVDLPLLPTIGIRPPTRPDIEVAAAVPEPTAALCFAVGLAAVAQRFTRRRG